ncbi:hypothetical protein EAF04_000679 [Stromatinia cepivora]|nr:hypothetical protein EAF04_000679 [Stromatinia cepivora]
MNHTSSPSNKSAWAADGIARSFFSPSTTIPSGHNSTSKLKLIPLELRREIWKYLLLNPDLGRASSIQKKDNYGAKAKYGLVPVILRVCKQFHEEGMQILYGENQFLIECVKGKWNRDVHYTALTRYCERLDGRRFNPQTQLFVNRLELMPGVKCVKHWKVLIAPLRPKMRTKLIEFCHSICHNQIKSIEVALIPWGDATRLYSDHRISVGSDSDWSEECFADSPTAENIQEVLFPLEMLRSIGKVCIREAELDEMPDFVLFNTNTEAYTSNSETFDGDISPQLKVLLPGATYLSDLIALIQGSTEIERFHDMYYTFLIYAQSFERIGEFRDCMALACYDFRGLFEENPFRGSWVCFDFYLDSHPVESAIFEASDILMRDWKGAQDIAQLKGLRSNTIKFLERQYQKIQKAADELVQFIKDQKKHGKLFDPTKLSSEFFYGDRDEAFVLLHNYAESFCRELTTATKIEICRLDGSYQKRFQLLPREIALRKCTNAYKDHNEEGFTKYFKSAVDDMDAQYIEIRNARKQLFKWDLKRPGDVAEIDVQPLKCDERIVWDEVEPDMDVAGRCCV